MGWAQRGVQKVVQDCPRCGSRRPKELVEGPKRLNAFAYLLFAFCTCGFGLLAFPIFNKRHLEAYCQKCGHTFNPNL